MEKQKHRFNLLDYFQDIFNENVWTRIFAFLLNSEEKHFLGNSVFNYWIEQISKEQKDFKKIFIDKLVELPDKIIAKTEWATSERRCLDLILELSDNAGNLVGIIGLENKVDSSEQEEQLSDYQKALKDTFPFVPKILLYCTPNGRTSETAIKNFVDCPYLPISYNSFKDVFEYFSKSTEGELQLIFNSTYNYLELMLAREKKREILSSFQDPSLPFNERNKYSPMMNFFNEFHKYCKEHRKFPFTKASMRTFSTNEIDINVEDLSEPALIPVYQLNSLVKEPRIGDYFVVRLMLWSGLLRTMKVKDKQPIINDILNYMRIPNTRNELKHWGPWVNIWTSNKYQLVDLGETDIKNLLKLLEESMNQTYSQLEKKYEEFVKLRPDIAL